MTITTAEKFLIDGVALNTYAWNVTTWAGRLSVPARKGEVVSPPGRSGFLPSLYAPFEPGKVTLAMWIVGCTVDGQVPTDRSLRAEFEANRARLINLFTRGGLMHLEQYKPDGTVREAWATMTSAIDFTTQAGGTRAEFNVQLDIPASFWQEPEAQWTETSITSLPTTLEVGHLIGSDAPVEDAIIEVTGAISNPQVTDGVSGSWVKLPDTVPDGVKWTIDAGAFSSTLGATPRLDVSNAGSSRLIVLTPQLGGPPYVTVSGSAPGPNAKVRVTAHRKFLTA